MSDEWLDPVLVPQVPERKKYGEAIAAQAKQKLMKHNQSELINTAKKLIDQLRKLSNDSGMEKREKHVRMSQRWSSLYRMRAETQGAGGLLVIPTHANLTAVPLAIGDAMRDYEPFSESSVTIERWEDGVEVSSLQRSSDSSPHPHLTAVTFTLTCR